MDVQVEAIPVTGPGLGGPEDATADSFLAPESGNRLIIQSPYTEEDHLLDLDTLDHENELLARALTLLENTREDYATAAYSDSFNWDQVMAELLRLVRECGLIFRGISVYVVAFRSQLKADVDSSHLGALDKAAHAEAVASGGFLKYWFGTPDTSRRNLATCLWTSREHAVEAGKKPAHRRAAMSTRELYTSWKIDQHRLTVSEGAESWKITPWR